ncbi:unnamed protein product [marine sediment metagenome]|uniref:Ribbon-helix-helix protein CopG domain-containing protein n=1 Tax=marine sediment metagenome TaxID=412755 RepID=X1P4Y1_9ZZZZ
MAKVKVSATIDRELVRWVDGQIKTRRFRNRSHAIEWALAKVAEDKTKK